MTVLLCLINGDICLFPKPLNLKAQQTLDDLPMPQSMGHQVIHFFSQDSPEDLLLLKLPLVVISGSGRSFSYLPILDQVYGSPGTINPFKVLHCHVWTKNHTLLTKPLYLLFSGCLGNGEELSVYCAGFRERPSVCCAGYSSSW
jgi:hypothetical protein